MPRRVRLSPIFASLYSGAILGGWPSLIAVPGAIMVLAGVFLTTRTPKAAVFQS